MSKCDSHSDFRPGDTPDEHGAKIHALHGREIGLLCEAASVTVAERTITLAEKQKRIIKIADRLNELITPHTPCKDGCSHCCYMAVAVSDSEARMIGNYLGRQPAVERQSHEAYVARNGGQEEYCGVPCTLLVDGKCSVYPVRPVACRTHHNLAKDNSNCVLTVENPATTPSFDLSYVAIAYAITTVQSNEGFADIREYFPKE